MTRTYQKKKRSEREAETRQRIVEATVALHTSVGPARTTISAIADKAGVQRHTVYSHFPEEDTLFAACTSHWALLHPFPPAEPREAAAIRSNASPARFETSGTGMRTSSPTSSSSSATPNSFQPSAPT